MQIWESKRLRWLDWRLIVILLCLMTVSLLIISSYSQEGGGTFFTPVVKQQIQWFAIGSILFLFLAGFDYNKLREWAWILYALMLFSLLGLFFTEAIQHVHRWYRLPFIGVSVQPSEYAKLITVISLSWFLERRANQADAFSTLILAGLIVLIPFILIFKQPDLGTALVLLPIALVMFYFGNVYPKIVRLSIWGVAFAFLFLALKFSGIIPHEEFRPIATKILKEYQYERLDPNLPHQRAAGNAIAFGGITGTGWGKSEFTAMGWLPAPYTDSVFPAFGEEFGLIGLTALLALFYALIYLSFQVSAVAKDHFGRLLAAGISVYLTVHILINIGMMIGLLPITGVPLTLVTYGGSSILATMAALGILQSIYCRRYMF